jgi:hypothetical protein
MINLRATAHSCEYRGDRRWGQSSSRLFGNASERDCHIDNGGPCTRSLTTGATPMRMRTMKRQRIASILTGTSFLALAFACSSEDASDSGDLGPKPANAARSTTCEQWQDASCDFMADQCSSISRAECDDSFQALFCKSDDEVQACISVLGNASCPDTPDACTGVADVAPAKWYCNTFVDLLCTRGEACDLGAKETCVKEAATSALDCNAAVGAGPAIETCLSKLSSVACESLSGGQLPAECQGVIKVLQSTATLSSPHAWPSWWEGFGPPFLWAIEVDR